MTGSRMASNPQPPAAAPNGGPPNAQASKYHHHHHHVHHVHHVHYQEPYELSQDLIAKQLELLEKKYGGSRKAKEAALTIQRAFRRSVHEFFWRFNKQLIFKLLSVIMMASVNGKWISCILWWEISSLSTCKWAKGSFFHFFL